METTIKKSIQNTTGSIRFEKDEKVFVTVSHDKPTIAVISGNGKQLKCYSVLLYRYCEGFESFTEVQVEEALLDGTCPSLTGANVEPDGTDEHGFPSILMAMGLV